MSYMTLSLFFFYEIFTIRTLMFKGTSGERPAEQDFQTHNKGLLPIQ